VLTAFFLEATFLGIMLFGRSRVSNGIHTLATVLVAVGTTFSAFWILALNSWMHTPVGFDMVDGQAFATDWFAIIFNPSFPYRLAHTLIASGLTVAFLLAGLSAYRHLKGDQSESNRIGLRTGVWLGALLIPIQVFVGDLHGLNTFEHQPAKVAAMEGVWEDTEGAPLLLFAWPDEETRSNRFELGIPRGASLILTHDPDGLIPGLNGFEGAHPPVAPIFFGFRIMVGVGMLMLLVSWVCAWRLRGGGSLPDWMHRVLVGMAFSGWVATVAGWYVTEIGRQPWLVQGVLSTAEAVSTVPAAAVATSAALYISLYVALVIAYVSVLFYLARQAAAGNLPRERTRLDNPFKPGATSPGQVRHPAAEPGGRA
jgi:cytochrome d ubiquinol oxidase subunit I